MGPCRTFQNIIDRLLCFIGILDVKQAHRSVNFLFNSRRQAGELTKSTEKKVVRNEGSLGQVALQRSHGVCQLFSTFG